MPGKKERPTKGYDLIDNQVRSAAARVHPQTDFGTPVEELDRSEQRAWRRASTLGTSDDMPLENLLHHRAQYHSEYAAWRGAHS
jgi:hypothetical protein